MQLGPIGPTPVFAPATARLAPTHGDSVPGPVDQVTTSASVKRSWRHLSRAGESVARQAAAALITLPDGTTRAYPKAQTSTTADTIHGVKIADPYRPLENVDSSATRGWVSQENQLTRDFLDKLPGRDRIQKAVEMARPKDVRSLPVVVGERMFYTHSNDGDQAAICSSNLDGKDEKVLFDPNPLSKEGTVEVNSFRVSPDGQKLAYGLMRNGSDWVDWHVRDLASGQDLPDVVRDTKYGDNLAWTDDSKGFFYPHFVRPGHGQDLIAADKSDGDYYHRLGTVGKDDKVAGSAGLPTEPSGDGVDSDGNVWHQFGKVGDTAFYTVKGDGIGRGNVQAVTAGDFGSSRTVLPEGNDVLQNATLVKGELVANYLQDGHSRLERFDPTDGTSKGAIALPGIGAVTGLRTLPDGQMLFDYSGPAYPPTVFRWNADTAKTDTLWQAKVSYNPDDYQTELAYSTSKDGTQVPLYVTRRKDTPVDGKRPTYLFGYGGFDDDELPENKPNLDIVPWLDMGGVFVDACLRGGDEHGAAWHKDGELQNKQHVFDDFIGAAEYLVKSGVTQPQKLAIGGRSNGGLLAAATEMERPDLFGAVVPEVGVMDLMRFPQYTSGQYWVSEYGDVNNEADFKNMLSYSPLQNVSAGKSYPSTLIITADHDDRVVPLHSYKLAATLQQEKGGNNPTLLEVEHDAGHGSIDHPWAPAKLAHKDTDRWSFLSYALGARPPA